MVKSRDYEQHSFPTQEHRVISLQNLKTVT